MRSNVIQTVGGLIVLVLVVGYLSLKVLDGQKKIMSLEDLLRSCETVFAKQKTVHRTQLQELNEHHKTEISNASSTDGLMTGEYFLPGTLDLPRSKVFDSCFTHPETHGEHFKANPLCSISDQHKLIYYLIPKAASSTNRHIMADQLGARESNLKQCDSEHAKRHVAFVRNPITRFFSQYEEMIARSLDKKEMVIPKEFRRFVDDLPNYKAYEAHFETEEGPNHLTNVFEMFVEDWDWQRLFDNHLALQVPVLSFQNTGMARDIDFMGDVGNIKDDWKALATKYKLPDIEVIKGRSFPRRMNITAPSKKAMHKVCRMAALDLCCLNYKLPDICLDSGVRCRWELKKEIDPSKRFIVPHIQDTSGDDIY